MLTRILYPVDLTPLSQKGLQWVANRVLRESSEMVAVHVVNPAVAGMDTPRYVHDAEISLDTLCQTVIPDHIHYKIIAVAGEEMDILPEIAHSEKCTFAILPVRKNEDIIPLVRHIAIPQFLLRTEEGDLPEEDVFNRIVMAVDLSPDRTDILISKMKDLLSGSSVNSEITLLHGVPLEEAQGSQILVNAAEEALHEVENTVKTWNSSTVSELLSGQPEEELPRRINEIHPTLLVVGLSLHGELWQLILGSTAIALIENTTCPVLIIPTS